jgi:hypothetical protein
MASIIRRLMNTIRHAGGGVRPTETSVLASGDLVSVVTDDGLFGVVKILAVDEEGVHARLYVQRFKRRPLVGDLGELSTSPFGPEHDNPFSIGHIPLSHRSFIGWEPEIITRGTAVAEAELDGYRMWDEAKGGYF